MVSFVILTLAFVEETDFGTFFDPKSCPSGSQPDPGRNRKTESYKYAFGALWYLWAFEYSLVNIHMVTRMFLFNE